MLIVDGLEKMGKKEIFCAYSRQALCAGIGISENKGVLDRNTKRNQWASILFMQIFLIGLFSCIFQKLDGSQLFDAPQKKINALGESVLWYI